VGLLGACAPATPAAAPAAAQVATAVTKPTVAPAATQPVETDSRNLFRATPKLATLQEELAVPPGMVEAAQKEGHLNIISSWDDDQNLKGFFDAFRKRYPGIEISYQEANENVRTVRTLEEFKAGRGRIDAVASIGGFYTQYKAAGAFLTMSDLPAMANYDPPLRTDFNSAGYQINVWGIAYNTTNVKPADVPQTWDDLTDPKWKGRIGLGDRPQLGIQALWAERGPDRATDFLKRLFANNPQRRKEGLDALTQLVGAGEFDIVVPASTHRTERVFKDGAPVAWAALDPFMVATSDVSLLKGPNPNAAKVFMNWLLSREGNEAFWTAIPVVPSHPLLRSDRKYQGIYADAYVGRKASIRLLDDEATYLPTLGKLWQELWLG
jgi:iron(III) transport system substrate-binding protein